MDAAVETAPKEGLSDLFGPGALQRLLHVEPIVCLDSISRSQRGVGLCVLTYDHIHVVAAEERRVERSIPLERIESLVESEFRDEILAPQAKNVAESPRLVMIRPDGNVLARDIAYMVSFVDKSNLAYLVKQAWRFARARQALARAYDMRDEKDSKQKHALRRIDESGYKALGRRLVGEFARATTAGAVRKAADQMSVLSCCSEKILELMLGDATVLPLAVQRLVELAQSVKGALSAKPDHVWSSHESAVESRRLARLKSFKVKLRLDRTRKAGIDFFQEEAGLRIYFIEAEPGQHELESGDVITKVAGRPLRGKTDDEQKAIWSRSIYNGAILQVERKIDESKMDAKQRAALDVGLLTSGTMERLRCMCSLYELLNRIMCGSVGLRGRDRFFQGGAVEKFPDPVQALGSAIMGLGLPEKEQKTTGLSALESLRRKLEAPGAGSTFSAGASLGPTLTVREGVQSLPLDEKDADAFKNVLRRVCHYQIEAMTNLVEVLKDPSLESAGIDGAARRNLFEKLSRFPALQTRIPILIQSLLTLIDESKANLSANVGFYIFRYAVVLNALVRTDSGLRVARQCHPDWKRILKTAAALRRKRQVGELSRNHYYRLGLPLLTIIGSLLKARATV